MSARSQTVTLTVFGAVILSALTIMLFFGERSGEVSSSPLQGQVVIRPAPKKSARTAIAKSGNSESETGLKKPLDEIWQIIRLGRHRIGYSRTTFEIVRKNGEDRVHTTTEIDMSVLRFGQKTRMHALTRTNETPSGDLLAFDVEGGKGRNKSLMTGRLKSRQMVVEIVANSRRNKRYYDWRKGIKSPTYQDRMLRTNPMKPKEIRRFKTFDPQLGRIIQVRLAADGYHRKRLHDGRSRQLLRVRVTQSSSPTEVVYSYLDRNGRPLISESEFIGKTMAHYTVPKAVALKTIQNDELDVGLRSILRTKPIPQAHKQPRIVYRISMERDDPAKYVVADDRQRLRRVDSRTIELTVIPSRMPRRSIHVRMDRKYVTASRFLQSNDRNVREHARRAAGFDTDSIKIALKMERYVSRKIKNKNFSTAMATAAEVARDMQGDCTEHAVLLAAMLRVRRIPSRIAIGLVYDHRMMAFVSHMWTDAWLGGKWVALDPTRGEGRIGAAHIKLAHASFADKSDDPVTAFVPLMNVLGKGRIEVKETGRGLNVPKKQFQPRNRLFQQFRGTGNRKQ